MERKIAILADSSSSIDHVKHEYSNIFQIRLSVYFDGVEYVDGKTITNQEFFRRIVEEKVIPTTSQPSVGQAIEVCEEIKNQGYTDIIYLPLSKGISSSYSSIMGSLDLIEDINIHVIDTRSTAVYLAFMTLEAARLVKENKTVNQIIDYVYSLVNHQHIYFMVNDLKYLVKNGRLSNAAGFIANMLKIKPVLEFNKEGQIVGTEKIRTAKKTMETIILHVEEAMKQYKKIQLCICHGQDLELLETFKSEVSKIASLDDILILPIPPVIGAHVGNSVVSLGYFVLEQ
jgi:DegV family protein with EDD domain